MADDERALGGYSRDAGRNAHEAGAPTLIPVPSLLRSLLSEHLDPGYAAAAARRREGSGPRRRASVLAWQVLAGLLVTTVFAAAAAQAQSVAPAARDSRHVLADGVRTAQRDTNDATAHRRDLSGQVEA